MSYDTTKILPTDGQPGQTDFIWSAQPEPHDTRKKAIMAKYGKAVNKLMGPEPLTKYIAVGVVALQLATAYAVANTSWPMFLAVAYVVGGTLTHNLFLAIHEITHHTAFRKQFYNDLLSICANVPIVVPYAMVFKVYHAEHHRYQGWDGVDTDIPCALETTLFTTTLGKLFFSFFQILFYALRPCLTRKIKLNSTVAMNWVLILAADYVVYSWAGPNAILYLLVSVLFAGAWHPLSGHFISEHYIYDPKLIQETYSYYGPLNVLAYNVGYHNEHHDFPNIPWSRLPELRKIAPEFYDHLITTPSWPGAIWWFITDPRVSTWTRVKRERGASNRRELLPTTEGPYDISDCVKGTESLVDVGGDRTETEGDVISRS